jgi:hypothetical protein
MLRLSVILTLVLGVVIGARSQSIPKELLSTPTRLELDKPTTDVPAGSTVAYTVTLKNARDQAIASLTNLQLQLTAPGVLASSVLTDLHCSRPCLPIALGSLQTEL